MLSVIILSVNMPKVVMLSVFMLNVILPNDVMLNVMAPKKLNQKGCILSHDKTFST